MKIAAAAEFSKRFFSQSSSWCYCKDTFVPVFEKLLAEGAFSEKGPGEKIWETKSKYVLKLSVSENCSIVYKGYRRISKGMSYLLRPSPCGFEAVNYQRIARLNIPVPEFLAAGEERCFFRLKDAFVITRFAEGFSDGREFLPGKAMAEELQLKEEFLRRHLIFLARCHDAGIYHRGFTLANIMWKKRVAPDSEGNSLDLLWIDLASCRKFPFFVPVAKCARDLSMCLAPLELSQEQLSVLVDIYCAARKKNPPRPEKIIAAYGA